MRGKVLVPLSAPLIFGLAWVFSATCAQADEDCPSGATGNCLIANLAAERKEQELKWAASEALVGASQEAIDTLGRSDPVDADAMAAARFEHAAALELVGNHEAAKAAYDGACPDAPELSKTPLCDLVQLRSMLLTSERDDFINFATQAIKAIGIDPDAVEAADVDQLLYGASQPYVREFRLEISSALAVLTKEDDIDRATKLALVVLANLEKDDVIAQTDVTSSARVLDYLIETTPGSWEVKPDGFEDVTYAERLYAVSKRLFGAENPRNYDALKELQTVVWNSTFAAMQAELDHTNDGMLGDPLAGIDKGESSASIGQRVSSLLRLLHDLIIRDDNLNRRERHLADLALSASVADEQESYARQIRGERDKLITEAVSQGKLPIAVKFQSAAAIAESEVMNGGDASAAKAKLQSVEEEVKKLPDSSPQLSRAYLAIASARRTLASYDAEIAKEQLESALVLIGRAEQLASERSEEESGVGALDLFVARSSIEEDIERLQKQ